MKKLTPMMQQYMDIKNQHQDALLLFRLGDFYELFFEDALTASRELEITLTGRDCGQEERAPMCGVPYHSVDSYIDRLITKGYKVAICDQVEDASQAVGLVKRDVVRIITPGTLIDTQLLDEKRNNYLLSLFGASTGWGVAYVDISTGELYSTEIKGNNLLQRLQDEITKIQPKEIIYHISEEAYNTEALKDIFQQYNLIASPYDSWSFEEAYALKRLKEHFKVFSVDGLGFEENHHGIIATGALLDYLMATQKRFLSHINRIQIYQTSKAMVLDYSTRCNLELTETIRGKSKKGSLLWVLDKTSTAMGGRMLRKWIEAPLLEVEGISKRLEAVEALKEDLFLRKDIKNHLRKVYDLERLAAKVTFGSANPRDLIALKASLLEIPSVKTLILNKTGLLGELAKDIDGLEDIAELIEVSIIDEPPISLKDGGIIKEGFNPEVDHLLLATKEGKQWIAQLEQKEKEATGIKSLKVGFNKVFGYYIEITKSYLKQAPDTYIRKQTLANCERYITPELKDMESKILGAEEKVIALEYQLFVDIRDKIGLEVERIQQTASALAHLDAIYSLGEVAAEGNYVKPIISSKDYIRIDEGRHPVVEKMLNNNMFISNNTYMDGGQHQISIITGPNMAGKSTYMRQVALIVLMAQIGSFIPAEAGEIGIVDRIFTRVGASDDLAQGQSTFMVEMSEMANILNCATNNSLLILDEIGRGTSTFDGLSIAWSVIEHISKDVGAKTLFSTHYHELTELEGKIKGVKNYRISVKEEGEDIIFLRKVIEGSADKSYGIQVARLAGLPTGVIGRANEILLQLEDKDIARVDKIEGLHSFTEEVAATVEVLPLQMDLSSLYNQSIIDEIRNINLLVTTPIEALNILANLQKKTAQSIEGGNNK